jgi:hypothetical protein
VFTNCHLYNKKGSPVHKLGVKLQTSFFKRIEAAGLSGGLRSKRSTAGLAAPKYEPQEAPEKKQRAGRAPAQPKAKQARRPTPMLHLGNLVFPDVLARCCMRWLFTLSE